MQLIYFWGGKTFNIYLLNWFLLVVKFPDIYKCKSYSLSCLWHVCQVMLFDTPFAKTLYALHKVIASFSLEGIVGTIEHLARNLFIAGIATVVVFFIIFIKAFVPWLDIFRFIPHCFHQEYKFVLLPYKCIGKSWFLIYDISWFTEVFS